ncbi:TPA: conjugal transfer protein [Klebsiella pneumoniae]|nr:conjugal transfer protein [Klebsiella pneumoniae]
MKREGFWRYATPPVNIQGVPLPFTMIYLFICPFPSKTTFWICTGIILFFVILDRSGWTVRTICTRIFSILREAIASGRPWWYRHHTESPRDWTGLD